MRVEDGAAQGRRRAQLAQRGDDGEFREGSLRVMGSYEINGAPGAEM
jgi:hypothetical protein